MVKTKNGVTVNKLSHPNSRKVHQLTKQVKKETARKKSKKLHQMRQNLIGEKFLWFRDNLPENLPVLENDVIAMLVEKYLKRFDEELEEINLKNSVLQRKNRQHASREDIIKITQLQESEELKTSGIELPNLLLPAQVTMLRKWNGELRFLQNFKLKRFSLQFLKSVNSKSRPQSPVVSEHDNLMKDELNCENKMDKKNNLHAMEIDFEKNKS